METHGRGTLKVYLGAAPGVGKTCAMLQEAHRLSASGVKVVVGIVEDHGREGTRHLVTGLTLIPRDDYGELNIPAILESSASLVLVDELAHSNNRPSGGKRWEDVQLLLDHGIDVISTVNIQHLESLGDVVANITGVVQHETIPDRVVREADTVELVDLSPEFLRTRIADGLVYAPERIGPALNNYFRPGNLIALRELALLWLADKVDDALAQYRSEFAITDTWETRERVVVAIAAESDAAPLIRRGRRIAQKSSAELLVVHVIGGDAFVSGAVTLMPKIRDLAKNVDAQVHQITGDSIPEALLHFARGVNATQLVLGVRKKPRWRRVLHEDTAQAVARGSGRIDVHLVTLDSASEEQSPSAKKNSTALHTALLHWGVAIVAPILATILGRSFNLGPNLSLMAALFFAVILVVSLLGGIIPALLSALLAGLLLNWFFTAPLHTFTISSPAHAFTLIVMLAMALAVALLVDKAKDARREAKSASAEADLLATFARAALRGAQPTDVMHKIIHVFGCLKAEAVDEHGTVFAVANSGEDAFYLAEKEPSIINSHNHSVQLRLYGNQQLSADHHGVLSIVADQLAGLKRQEELGAEAAQTKAVAAADELRRALLSAVSHDLRSPLAAAKIAVSSLRATDLTLTEEDRSELLETIEDSVDELSDLVGNLLDSSRLAAGAVSAQLRSVPLEETIYRAIGKRGMESGRVRVSPQCAGVWVYADASLLERVIANLVDNALHHAPGSEVLVGTRTLTVGELTTAGLDIDFPDGAIEISVKDSGPGISPEADEKIWQPFQRLGDQQPDSGVGLGLDIARGFTTAMGGTINLRNRLDGPGACATVVLPVPKPQVTIPPGQEDRQ
ncbi:DUF4118 domain-containing protein [Corynebacterium poyangense]|uniref:histidine kinase n=1 Tax=Corynebacterium poyangense TaxID=2684405 RepID=A0A7H0SQ61_9CORY|nr:DUF4118 domain-containing protein [Corynebacterium poyangense]QNQ90686.1 DUF4118 domain-containing protein [Corynebacterium poyangense]